MSSDMTGTNSGKGTGTEQIPLRSISGGSFSIDPNSPLRRGGGGCAPPPEFYQDMELGGDRGPSFPPTSVPERAQLKLSVFVITVREDGYVIETSRQDIDYPNGTPALQRNDVIVDENLFNQVTNVLDNLGRVRYVHGDIICEDKPNAVVKERIDKWFNERKAGSIGINISDKYETIWFDAIDLNDLTLANSLYAGLSIEDEAGTLVDLSGQQVQSVSFSVLEFRSLLTQWLHETRRKAKEAATLSQLNAILKETDIELENLPWYRA